MGLSTACGSRIPHESLLQKPDGRYRLGESFVTVSLGEPFKDACYKLIAGIIKRPRALTCLKRYFRYSPSDTQRIREKISWFFCEPIA